MVEHVQLKPKSKGRLFWEKYFGKTKGDNIFHICNYLLFIFLAFICFYPFWHVLKKSLITRVDGNEILDFSAYSKVLFEEGLLESFILTVGVVIVFVLLHVFLTMLSAYPLSRKNLKGRKFILLFLIITMLFSGGLIPYYLLIQELNLNDNLLVYIIPGLISPFNIIIARNFISGIPNEVFESAKMDGANEVQILFKIVFPLSGAIVATIALWAGVGKWNDWTTGLYYISDSNKYLIQNFLREILLTASSGQGNVDADIAMMGEQIKMAAIIVSIVPILVIYPFVQKFFVKGVLLGSVKS